MATSLFAHASVHHSIRRLIAVLALTLTGLAGSARAQSLGVQGDHFIVDGEAKFLTFVSYFDGMRATDYDGDFAFLKDQAGFDGVRIFPNWWTYSGSPTNCPAAATDTLFDASGNVRGDNGDVLAPSGRLLRLIQVLRAAQKYRLIVDLSFTRETVSGSLSIANYQRALQRTAFLLREYPQRHLRHPERARQRQLEPVLESRRRADHQGRDQECDLRRSVTTGDGLQRRRDAARRLWRSLRFHRCDRLQPACRAERPCVP